MNLGSVDWKTSTNWEVKERSRWDPIAHYQPWNLRGQEVWQSEERISEIDTLERGSTFDGLWNYDEQKLTFEQLPLQYKSSTLFASFRNSKCRIQICHSFPEIRKEKHEKVRKVRRTIDERRTSRADKLTSSLPPIPNPVTDGNG